MKYISAPEAGDVINLVDNLAHTITAYEFKYLRHCAPDNRWTIEDEKNNNEEITFELVDKNWKEIG